MSNAAEYVARLEATLREIIDLDEDAPDGQDPGYYIAARLVADLARAALMRTMTNDPSATVAMKLIAHAIQMCTDEQPYARTAVAFKIDEEMYGAEVSYYPLCDKDGQPTGRRHLEVKVKRIDHPGELAP